MTKVFIGMPTYNGERFIKKAIDSLCAQSYTDWIMLISDDASTDSTPTICQEYAAKDPRITFYRQEKNIGQFANFKFLIDRAQGDYFMWAGHDDLWEKDFIKVCIKNLKNNPDRGLAFTGHNVIDIDDTVVTEYPHFSELSGPANVWTICRFVQSPEIQGKPNLMYSVFRLPVVKRVWGLCPQYKRWGADILFSLAALSHFGVIIDKSVLFHKRLGGYSDPHSHEGYRIERGIHSGIFPVGGGRFSLYLKGHMQALEGTPYKSIVFILLLFRSIRALALHLASRNYQKYLPNVMTNK